MEKHGWIIYNGHLPGGKFLEFAEWMQDSATKLDLSTRIIKNNHLLSLLSSEGNSIIERAKFERPDFVLFGDKDIHLAKQLELMNIPVFNSSEAIEISDNKITTYQRLAEKGLPIPKTIVGPKIFAGVTDIDTSGFNHLEDYLNFPIVVKEAYGSFGEQVYLIKSRQELFLKLARLEGRPFVLQEFISSSYGKDIRLNVVGDQVVASMLRTSSNDFRANVSAGGKMEIYHPSLQEKELAIAATKAIGADFSGVDLLFGPDDEPIVCEINSNAHIRNIYECTKINVANYIMDYICSKLK
ncbi:RimK family alpha-L-glutamate ligase [Aquibacillus halophilus]|uniref:RimK family alpha-L-glutamate ligase n=1 Tax=Aquibacillus halophilus TaxID=930132 RepID=A0A6A8DBG4_9BACI|nr:RimK family alpha-L-glutamate ligase [Aquibacillus halophilus]MRH42958.1 RimK family alpha-L-glutamate ligase [Aquibacillus halophilus]